MCIQGFDISKEENSLITFIDNALEGIVFSERPDHYNLSVERLFCSLAAEDSNSHNSGTMFTIEDYYEGYKVALFEISSVVRDFPANVVDRIFRIEFPSDCNTFLTNNTLERFMDWGLIDQFILAKSLDLRNILLSSEEKMIRESTPIGMSNNTVFSLSKCADEILVMLYC